MTVAVLAPFQRRTLAWSLAGLGLVGALLGWLGLYAVASTFAAGTAWWVGVGFIASGPVAVAGLILAIRELRLSGAVFVCCLALFIFAALWIALLAMKLAA